MFSNQPHNTIDPFTKLLNTKGIKMISQDPIQNTTSDQLKARSHRLEQFVQRDPSDSQSNQQREQRMARARQSFRHQYMDKL